MFGWGKRDVIVTIDGVEYPMSIKDSDLILAIRRVRNHRDNLRIALAEIADMETPSANATVKRMAKVAREAL